MPDGRSHKSYDDYGPHEYGKGGGTSDCQHGCGCWAGPARSGGPPGIDPLGHCPNNPLDGQRQPENDDYEDCVNGLIEKLRSELYKAQEAVRIVETAEKSTKTDLARRLKEAEGKKARLIRALDSFQNLLLSSSNEILKVLDKSS